MTRDPQRLGEVAANVLMAVVLGIVGAALLVHYLTPCAEGVLCMAAALDVDKLLRSGAIEGPYRRARPLTLTLSRRIRRWLRAWILGIHQRCKSH